MRITNRGQFALRAARVRRLLASLGALSLAGLLLVPLGILGVHESAFAQGPAFAVQKIVSGTPLSPAPTSYTATLTCTPPGGSPTVTSVTVLADGTIFFVPGGVPANSSCTIVETNPPAGAVVTYDLNGSPITAGVAFNVGSNGAVVHITNTFPAQVAVRAQKALVNTTPTSPVPATFDATLICTPAGGTALPAVQVSLPADGTVVSTPGIFVGSSCTINETTPPAGATVTYSPSATFIVGPNGADVTVTNEFSTMTITKTLAGLGAQAFAHHTFHFFLTCVSPTGDPVPGLTDFPVGIAGTGLVDTIIHSDPIGGMPVGSMCTAFEAPLFGEVGPSIPPTNSGPVTIIAGTGNQIDFVNHYSAGTVSVAKTVSGAESNSPEVQGASFSFDVTCEIDVPESASGGTIRLPLYHHTLTVRAGEKATALDPTGNPLLLPGGSHCFATETVTNGASQSIISNTTFDTGVVITSDPGEGNFMIDQAVTIEATNIFEGPATVPAALALASAGDALTSHSVFGAFLFGTGIVLLVMTSRRRV